MKTNRFLVVAGISLALALTLSCSDDDDGGSGGAKKACLYDDPGEMGQEMPGSFCIQAGVEIPKDKCDGDGKLQESCPSKPDKTCPMNLEGYDVEVLLYGYVAMYNCDQMKEFLK